jgi:predicted nucleic acid-binding protein
LTDGRPLVFDTGVYIAAIRAGVLSPAYGLLQENLPRTYLASVVSAELLAGCTNDAARRAVRQFTQRSHQVRRVVTPGRAAWERAGDVLAEIRRAEPHLGSKLRTLWNDVLVALSAREIGARVVTYDRGDFALIRRHLGFELQQLS